jgi:hypothetical protein
MHITIEEVTKKTGKNGEYLSIKADGKYYSCFKDAIFSLFHPTAVLDVEIEEKGKYRNITDAKVIEQPTSNESTVGAKWNSDGYESGQKSREIARMNSLTNAVNLLQGKDIPDEKLVNAVLRVAERFYQWIKKEPTQC